MLQKQRMKSDMAATKMTPLHAVKSVLVRQAYAVQAIVMRTVPAPAHEIGPLLPKS